MLLLDLPLAGYRLRIHGIKDMPVVKDNEHSYEYQLGVTMFDEEHGAFYGNTVSGAVDTAGGLTHPVR